MTGPVKIIIMFVLWLLFSLLAYQSCLKQCCLGDEAAISQDAADTGEMADSTDASGGKRYALDFQWDNATPNVNPGFDDVKTNILKEDAGNNILVIEGRYFEGEAAPEGYDNMGFARAAEIRKLFPDIPDERIQLLALRVGEREGVRDNYFEAAKFSWKDPEEEAATVEEVGEGEDVRFFVRFPSNSTQKIYDADVDKRLDELATRVKASGEKISLIGHTDTDGNAESNMLLGRNRAREIRSILVSKGVEMAQIVIDSKGQTDPRASNATDAGKSENRRVEVELIKLN